MKLIDKLRSDLTALLEKRTTLEATKKAVIDAVEARGESNLTDAETTTVREARSGLEALDTEAETLRARIVELEQDEAREARSAEFRKEYGTHSPAKVVNEARTYTPEASAQEGRSFFVDSYRSQFSNDAKASERLQRHAREVEVEGESRATSTPSFSTLVVPQYLVDEAAAVLRAGRPIANRVRRMPLPAQGTSFNIPRGTTGASVASQAAENTNVSNTDEAWANLTISLVTISGQQDVSRQSLERGTPGIDSMVYMDLAGAYAAELDRQVINGSGASGQMLGILQTAGVSSGTAFGAAVSAANFYTKTAGAQNGVLTTRFLPPSAIYMHPRRWAWALSQSDSAGRPLVVPLGNGVQAFNAQGVLEGVQLGVAGTLQGLPVVVDANMPTNVGAATGGEDVVIVSRESDLYLWEDGDGAPRELRFEQTLGNQLTTKLVVYGYAAFTAGRYPQAVAKFGGLDTTTSGLVAPTF